MADRRHAIEQMRRVTRAGADALERLLVGRAGVSERHVMPVRGERPDERDRAVEFRRDRHDPDVGPRRRNLGEDLLAGELALGTPARSARGRRRHSSGCAPRYSGLMKLLSRCAGSTRDARRRPGESRGPHRGQHRPKIVGRAGNRRRAERGDAVAGQPRGDALESRPRRRASRSLRRRARARR